MQHLSTLQNVSVHTLSAYEVDLKQFFSFTEKNLNEIERDDIRAFIASLNEKSYRTNSCRRKIAAIKGFFRYVFNRRWLSSNPASSILFKKRQKRLPKALFNQQIEEILIQASKIKGFLNIRNALIFELLYATGLRVSELINLKWGDINEGDKTIKVFGKGKKWRLVPMTQRVMDKLSIYHVELANFLVSKKKSHDNVFVNNLGSNITARGVQFICESFAKKWGLDLKMHPHVFRHTYATSLLENGADIRSVQELLGHKGLSTTQIYTHLSINKLKKDYFRTHPLAQKIASKNSYANSTSSRPLDEKEKN